MELTLANEIASSQNFPLQTFLRILTDEEYKYNKSESYNGGHVTDLTDALASYQNKDEDFTYATYQLNDTIGFINATYGATSLYVAGNDLDELARTLEYLKLIAPEEETPEDNTVYVTFWANGNHGPVSRRRKLEVPAWDEIVLNYHQPVTEHVDRLMVDDFRPGKGGQLLLWHGEPGTGKTTALRAMARQWKEWCEIHYITDPESFFGSSADYMMQVMADAPSSDNWRLLVLEDCGELLSADARTQMHNPQGLSRFLNAVDGLLGQGLKIMVLVTTNEPLKKLHPAVSRPGRCLSIIEFENLTPDEVQRWGAFNGVEPEELVGSKPLSELFAIAEGAINTKPQSKSVGFG